MTQLLIPLRKLKQSEKNSQKRLPLHLPHTAANLACSQDRTAPRQIPPCLTCLRTLLQEFPSLFSTSSNLPSQLDYSPQTANISFSLLKISFHLKKKKPSLNPRFLSSYYFISLLSSKEFVLEADFILNIKLAMEQQLYSFDVTIITSIY